MVNISDLKKWKPWQDNLIIALSVVLAISFLPQLLGKITFLNGLLNWVIPVLNLSVGKLTSAVLGSIIGNMIAGEVS